MGRFDIEPNRKKELIAFCRQYPDIVTQLEEGVQRKGYAYIPKRLVGKNITDNVAKEVILRDKLIGKKLIIEQAAREAEPNFFDEIIAVACYGKKFDGKWYIESGLKESVNYFYYLLDFLKE